MSKHTKGPWTAADALPETNSSMERIPIEAPDNPEATCISEEYNGCKYVAHCFGPDREANARLIAAAPDLLEALRLAVATIHKLRILANINANAIWRAVDALHNHDTPRETTVDDATAFRTAARDEELEREEKRMNETNFEYKDFIIGAIAKAEGK